MKKYDFTQERDNDFDCNAFKHKNRPAFSKVHWEAPEQKAYDKENFYFPCDKEDNLAQTLKMEELRGHLKENRENHIKSASLPRENVYEAPRKDFEKLCQNLNNKLNKYLTTITGSGANPIKESYCPKINLEFN